jgi:hypothetical protein
MAQGVWLFHRRDESNGWRMIPRRNAQKINTRRKKYYEGRWVPSQFVLRQFEAQWRDGSDRHSFSGGELGGWGWGWYPSR